MRFKLPNPKGLTPESGKKRIQTKSVTYCIDAKTRVNIVNGGQQIGLGSSNTLSPIYDLRQLGFYAHSIILS